MALVETLTDNFDDNSLDGAKWAADTAGGGAVAEQNQRIEISGASFGQNARCNAQNSYDLTGSYQYGRVSNWQSGDYSTFGMSDTGGDEYYVTVVSGGTIAFKKLIAAVESQIGGGLTYVAADHAWWRIRESGGTIYADTASSSAANPPDAGDWTNRWSETTDAAFGLTAIKPFMDHYSGASSRVTYFDGFNTAATVGGGGGKPDSYYRMMRGA